MPHVATHAVGMPDWPRSTVKPFFSRMPVRYFEVSTSWKPSSPKLNTESTISCASLARPSTCSVTPRLSAIRVALSAPPGGGAAAGLAAGACASAVAALSAAAAIVNPKVIVRAIVLLRNAGRSLCARGLVPGAAGGLYSALRRQLPSVLL